VALAAAERKGAAKQRDALAPTALQQRDEKGGRRSATSERREKASKLETQGGREGSEGEAARGGRLGSNEEQQQRVGERDRQHKFVSIRIDQLEEGDSTIHRWVEAHLATLARLQDQRERRPADGARIRTRLTTAIEANFKRRRREEEPRYHAKEFACH
jgi:hypothetical protein